MPTTVRSFSKINIGLAIGPPRADGFHGLATCYQTLAAHDLVTVEAQRAAAASIRLTSNHAGVPLDNSNTAWKMVERALALMGCPAEVEIHIDKHLPIQGGIGAGSANAVAALMGLERELAAHGVPPLVREERMRIAAEVGSDVPLFLLGGAVLGTGRGEAVSALPDFSPTECVLAIPGVAVSTPEAFRAWDALHPTASLTGQEGFDRLETLSRALSSAFTPRLAADLSAAPGAHSSGVSANSADLAGKRHPLLALVRTGIENDFEQVVFRQYPFLGTIRRLLAESVAPEESALYAALSGSGSAVFGLYGSADAAAAAERRLGEAGVRALRTRTLPREDYWRMMLP
jgi:4-diphosphocytidyl-2-C-methyl-D-erythritol kinase